MTVQPTLSKTRCYSIVYWGNFLGTFLFESILVSFTIPWEFRLIFLFKLDIPADIDRKPALPARGSKSRQHKRRLIKQPMAQHVQ